MRIAHLWPVLFYIAQISVAQDAVSIGSQRELFVDRALIERIEGQAELRLHHPTPREIVMAHDAPWEGNSTTYHCVLRDGERYRMYYVAGSSSMQNGQLATGPEVFCYAESDDGIRWRRPDLGLHEFQGSKSNNILLNRATAELHRARIGAPAVFKDENPRAAPEGRYKMFLHSQSPLGMLPMQSPDGIHWSPLSDRPVITDGAFDSMNLACWDAARGEYRAYWRYFTRGTTTEREWKPGGVRAIRTATSPDFLHWNAQADLTYGDASETELYENGIHPYHRAPQLLIGLPVRYVDRAGAPSTSDGSDRAGPQRIREWPPSLRALPDFELRQARAALSERFGSALTESLFMSSRDGVAFHRWEEAFLRPGIERTGTWNYGHQFVAWQPVETPSTIVGAPNELSIYATEGNWLGKAGDVTSLRRYTLRLDGFVSLHASAKGGELLTKPLECSGHTLTLNFSTSAAGSVRVELQDREGRPLPGFQLADCDDLFGDTLDRTVSWSGRSDLSSAVKDAVRLRFVLRDADVYSFQFRD